MGKSSQVEQTVCGSASPRIKKDADYVFYELTRSICPNCRKVIEPSSQPDERSRFCRPKESRPPGDAFRTRCLLPGNRLGAAFREAATQGPRHPN